MSFRAGTITAFTDYHFRCSSRPRPRVQPQGNRLRPSHWQLGKFTRLHMKWTVPYLQFWLASNHSKWTVYEALFLVRATQSLSNDKCLTWIQNSKKLSSHKRVWQHSITKSITFACQRRNHSPIVGQVLNKVLVTGGQHTGMEKNKVCTIKNLLAQSG